jgi:tRNA/rRNA methyltransferase
MTPANLLANLAIVLVRPKIAENIGAAARVACNMGIQRLILVRDELPPHETMAKMATHKAVHLIDNLEIYPTLAEALAHFSLIIGTTARRGRQRWAEQTPREIVATIMPFLPTNQTAILFGAEDTGLTNDELKHCHHACAIPTAEFSSLNLAQAVAIVSYELYYGLVHAAKDMTPSPQLATSFELESMYQYLEDALRNIHFVEEVNRDYWMNNIRRLFARQTLTSKEANIIRGACKKFIQFSQTP